MAVDTVQKRFSMMAFGEPDAILIKPDATIEKGDRQHLLGCYSGIGFLSDFKQFWAINSNQSIPMEIPMKKNVASQLIAVQLISATDGSDVTSGTTNVAVELDGVAGTGGTATHIANGKWEYAPIQGDTNADHITFHFTNSSAITVLMNVYPSFPQTVDNDVLASGATGFGAINTDVEAIKTKTDLLPSATAGAAGGVFIAGTNAATAVTTSFTTTFTGNLTGSVGSVTGAVGSVTGSVGSVTGAVGSVTGAVGSVTAAITLPTIPTNWITADGAAADFIGASEIAASASQEIADLIAADWVAGDASPLAIASAVWDTDATAHQTTGSFGQAIGDPVANTKTLYAALVTDAVGASVTADVATVQSDTDDLQTQIGAAGAGLTAINLPDQTMNITGNITGNLSGTVGSVTGAVGSVTGSVGSVTGAVGSVTGAVGSVTATVTADLDTIKTQAVTCAAGVTVNPSVGAATIQPTVTQFDARTLVSAGYASPTNITAGTITTVTNLTNAATAGDLTAAMKTSVNTEIVDGLNVDTYAEPGQGTPASTASISDKLGYIYKGFRNRKTQTATTWSLYNDDATTVDQKSTVSDNGTTADKTELVTGP